MRYAFLLVLLGCGSSETTSDAGADATSDQKAKDVAFGFDTGSDGSASDAGPPSCPQSAPTAGTACSGVGLCEYGPSFWPECNVLRECNGSVWSDLDESSECPAPFDGGCPADASTNGTCGAPGWCEYPNQECFCVGTCGGPPPMPTGNDSWVCVVPQSNCPWPRPRFGDACTTEGQSCGYQICCGGASMTCTGGHWTGSISMFGCP